MAEHSRSSSKNLLWRTRRYAAITLASAVAAAAGVALEGCGSSSSSSSSASRGNTPAATTPNGSPNNSGKRTKSTPDAKPSGTPKPGFGTTAELSQLKAISVAALLTREEVNSALQDPSGNFNSINTVTSDPITGNGEFAAAIYSSGAPTSNYGQPNSLRIAISNYSGRTPATTKLSQSQIQQLENNEKAAGVPQSTIDRGIANLQKQESEMTTFSENGYSGFVSPLPENVALVPGQTKCQLFGEGVRVDVLGDSSYIDTASVSGKENAIEGLCKLVALRLNAKTF